MIALSQIQDVKRFISENWDSTVRRSEQPALAIGTRPLPQEGEIALPAPFTVPTAGPEFHIFFYWDTFFTCEGLLRDGRFDLARANADNFLYLIDLLGYVPNYTLWQDLDRSQPPVASLLVRAVYEHAHVKSWLAQAQATLEKEYTFWMTFRCGPHGLNHYGNHGSPKMVENFQWHIPQRLVNIPTEPVERMQFVYHAMAEAESGWDFTPRFSRRCADHYAVDLNSLLYLHERNQAWFCQELGNGQREKWIRRAEFRRQRFNELCWNDAKGFYYDYDFVEGRCSPVEAVSAYFALWSGLATPEQAVRLVQNLPLLERDFGLLTCAPGERPAGQVYQWDAPNAWPPMQYAVIAGLLAYGFTAEARRIAEKYVTAVARSFEATGNLWEKYNALAGDVSVADEYHMPAMLGWTAGTFLYACEVLGL